MKIYRSRLQEINLGTNTGLGTGIKFNDDPYMRDAYIFGISLILNTDLTNSPAFNLPLIDQAAGSGIVLNVQNRISKQVIERIPILTLNDALNFGIQKEFYGVPISLVDSGVIIADPTNIVANTVVSFNMFYLLPNDFRKLGIDISKYAVQ